MYPEDLGLSTHKPAALHGGESVEDAARIFMNILEGKGTKAQNEAVLANAGMALYCGKLGLSLKDSIEAARESLVSGKALDTFNKLIAQK
jgi:anthranilate phosphoribosyltransferase